MKSIGIDIGSSSIKVVEVSSNNKGQIKISNYVEHPLGTNPAFDPEIEIIEFLKGFTSSYDPGSTKFVLGLRQDRVSVRHKTFPFSDRLKIQKSLPFELEEDLPFSSDSAIFDAKIIRIQGASAEVLACASPKARIQELMNRFGDLGFEISIVSAEGIALANCFENWQEAPSSNLGGPLQIETELSSIQRHVKVVVHIGHTRTLVSAFENNALVAVRSLLWGGKNVADSIARRYEIPYVEALKEMQTKAFILPSKEGASYDQIVFSDTIANQFRDLSRDLKISILEMTSELNAQIDSVGLTGGTSQVLHLQAFLTQQLELPVNRIQVLEGFASSAFEKTTKIDSQIGVALGLAIEGLKKPRNPALQFLRGDFARQNTSLKKFWDTWGVSLQFALAFYVAFFIYTSLRDNFSTQLAERAQDALKTQAQNLAHLPKKQANENGVKKYIREQKKRAQEIRTVVGMTRMNSALDILKKISDSLPPKTSVTLNVKKFKVEDNSVLMEGTVLNSREFSLLQKSLLSVAVDGKLENKSPSLQAPVGSQAFAIQFKVDRGVDHK